MLELINLARTNPTAAAERVTSNLTPDVVSTLKYYGVDANQAKREISSATPQPPVAWNAFLGNAAQGHSQDMANTRTQSHEGSDGSTINSRISNAGYLNATSAGENAYAYATNVDEAMQAFLLDWGVADKGHRRNLLQPNVSADDAFTDVGIGIVRTNDNNFGPVVITQDFGSQPNAKGQLLGAVFSDGNSNDFYDVGEGAGNVLITARNLATGQSSSIQTWDAGGYQMPLDPGNYLVTVTVNNKVVKSTNITMGLLNVLHNFNLNDPSQDAPPATSSAPAQSQSEAQIQTQTQNQSSSNSSTDSSTFSLSSSNQYTPTRQSTSGGFLAKWSSWKARLS